MDSSNDEDSDVGSQQSTGVHVAYQSSGVVPGELLQTRRLEREQQHQTRHNIVDFEEEDDDNNRTPTVRPHQKIWVHDVTAVPVREVENKR